ncbi:MAG: response regulator transcription factor [Planctomycetes bacterium]|nr:response regulator transcription factor [Planctomycetota bacterium]
MPKARVLVVEDDAAIRQGVVDALAFEGYETLEAARGDEALELAAEAEYDLLLLDLVLPGCRGLDILRDVRASRPTTPVIILTALGDESDRVQGLRLGADDYVVKPFSVRELLARVEAVLRRSPERPSDIREIVVGTCRADLNRRELSFDDGQRVELSDREAVLLRYLAQHAGRVVSRQEMLYRVWHLSPDGLDTRTVDMHVARLRQKLRDDTDQPRMIVTVRGKGYMIGTDIECR